MILPVDLALGRGNWGVLDFQTCAARSTYKPPLSSCAASPLRMPFPMQLPARMKIDILLHFCLRAAGTCVCCVLCCFATGMCEWVRACVFQGILSRAQPMIGFAPEEGLLLRVAFGDRKATLRYWYWETCWDARGSPNAGHPWLKVWLVCVAALSRCCLTCFFLHAPPSNLQVN